MSDPAPAPLSPEEVEKAWEACSEMSKLEPLKSDGLEGIDFMIPPHEMMRYVADWKRMRRALLFFHHGYQRLHMATKPAVGQRGSIVVALALLRQGEAEAMAILDTDEPCPALPEVPPPADPPKGDFTSSTWPLLDEMPGRPKPKGKEKP
jgi:hypothetical protein